MSLPVLPGRPPRVEAWSRLRFQPRPVETDSDQRLIRIVPKGLRSFDEHDADFFLELLARTAGPGWSAREHPLLEDADRLDRFRADVPGGSDLRPSGCGKSSLVKAGLLPRLAKHVLPVYVEATPEETESPAAERACARSVPTCLRRLDWSIPWRRLRRGGVLPPGQKVLLVLDQFEQWLHAKRGEENTELVAALRQCDGEHVQAVVMVRDDFWMAATRFMMTWRTG